MIPGPGNKAEILTLPCRSMKAGCNEQAPHLPFAVLSERKQEKPQYFEEAREYTISRWKAIPCDGMEADDAVGIYNYKWKDKHHVIMAHIDKDLDMLEGHHYNFRTRESYYIDEVQAYRKFYTQMLTGDTSDNIPGLFKFTGKKATAKIKTPIEEMTTKEEMHEYVKEVYNEAYNDGDPTRGGEGIDVRGHKGDVEDNGLESSTDRGEAEVGGTSGEQDRGMEGEHDRDEHILRSVSDHLNLIGKLLWIKRS